MPQNSAREDIGRSRPADVFTLPPLTLVGLTITDVEDLDWASCQSVGKAAGQVPWCGVTSVVSGGGWG